MDCGAEHHQASRGGSGSNAPQRARGHSSAAAARELPIRDVARRHGTGRAPTAGSEAPGPFELSVVAPVFDEAENLAELYRQVRAALDGVAAWELLLVDDGSRDGSDRVIRALARSDERVVGVFFARNRGQSGALAAGIELARAPLIATIDADLQNDPADLPALLDALGVHDAVVGARRERRDDVVRRVSSRIANRVRNWISGDSIRDTGCSLKVFRADAIRAVPFFDGMHRFMPTLLRYHGFSVAELLVGHRPRVAGVSKYGVWNRAFRAFVDLLAVRWMKGRILLLPIGHVTTDGPAPAVDRTWADERERQAAVAREPRSADSR